MPTYLLKLDRLELVLFIGNIWNIKFLLLLFFLYPYKLSIIFNHRLGQVQYRIVFLPILSCWPFQLAKRLTIQIEIRSESVLRLFIIVPWTMTRARRAHVPRCETGFLGLFIRFGQLEIGIEIILLCMRRNEWIFSEIIEMQSVNWCPVLSFPHSLYLSLCPCLSCCHSLGLSPFLYCFNTHW